MKYTFCEKLMWFAMNKTIMNFLKENHPKWNINKLKSKSKKRYKEIISELPDIGKITENSMRLCLSGGAVWLAIYESCEEQISEKEFEEIVKVTMKAPILVKAFSSKKPFTKEAQLNKAKSVERDNNASNSEYNWKMDFIPGKDEEEYTIIYKQCGLCALARKEKHPELVKYMCNMDILSVDMFGGVLYRTKTIANGQNCCDFYICKKGSHWNIERENNMAIH